jgi:anti-anti-sigma regulatory factor
MTNESPNGLNQSAKVRKARVTKQQVEQSRERTVIAVERSGDWMPADELREAALVSVREGKDLTLDLDKVDHLDASALQILLALEAAQKEPALHTDLANASPHLRQWFDYAGVVGQSFMARRNSDE